MPNNVQNIAKTLAAEYHNTRAPEWGKKPITAKDVRVLFWRNTISDNIWTVVAWVQNPEAQFYVVTGDKSTRELSIDAYVGYDTEVYDEKGVKKP